MKKISSSPLCSPALALSARRNFLLQAAGLCATAASPFALNLAAIGAASAQSTGDYKALVCVFLFGGNDQANTLMPSGGAERSVWRAARPDLLLPGQVLPITPAGYTGVPQALAAQLSGLKSLFDTGQCAVLANVGPLVQPMTLGQWSNGNPTVPVPPQIASHSDQQNVWQSGVPDKPATTGWLGRIADLVQPAFNSGSVSMCISTGGDNGIQVGQTVLPYQITDQGAVRVQGLNGVHEAPPVAVTALRGFLTPSHNHDVQSHYTRIGRRAIDAEQIVSSALAGVNVTTAFPDTSLGRQLRMVARMVAARGALGQRRQVFFVSSGGWDFHANQVNDQSQRLSELSQALTAFQQSTEALGVARNVTAVTASEFGRALQSNGDGTDHGWGGHHFIVGGAVRGGRIYGQLPDAALRTSTDIGQGRLLPTTSVDAYAATLARWFGVSDTDLPTVLPNASRFLARGSDLGFLA